MRSIATLLLVSIVTASVAGDCEKHFFNFGQILRGYNGIKGNPNSIEQTDPGNNPGMLSFIDDFLYENSQNTFQDSGTPFSRQCIWMTPHQMGSTAFHLVLVSTIARVHATSVDKQMRSKRKHFQEYNVWIQCFNLESCSNLGKRRNQILLFFKVWREILSNGVGWQGERTSWNWDHCVFWGFRRVSACVQQNRAELFLAVRFYMLLLHHYNISVWRG